MHTVEQRNLQALILRLHFLGYSYIERMGKVGRRIKFLQALMLPLQFFDLIDFVYTYTSAKLVEKLDFCRRYFVPAFYCSDKIL